MLDWIKGWFNHPGAPNLYSYHQGLVLTNGTRQLVFDQETTLPSISFRGSGRTAKYQLNSEQPAQVRANLAVPIAGIGGLMAGQIQQQPLIDSGAIYGG